MQRLCQIYSHEGLFIDLQNNDLKTLPQEITQLKKVLWMLSGNPFLCNCDTLWLRGWLDNANASKNRVLDYRDAVCHGGKLDGNPVLTMQAKKMGCLSHVLAREAIVAIACLLTFGLIMLCLAAVVIKRWNEIRWIIYKKANRFIAKGDDDDDLENIVFDAFIAYR